MHSTPLALPSHVQNAYGPGSAHSSASSVLLLYALEHCMIRHTKLQVLGGEEVLTLPPKTEELVPGGFGGVAHHNSHTANPHIRSIRTQTLLIQPQTRTR